MGIITNDFTRLAGEIRDSHQGRMRMIQSLRRNEATRKREVQEMQAGFHASHVEMSRNQRKALRDFAAGIENLVSAMLKGFSDDLEGGRRSWRGIRTPELKSCISGKKRSEDIVPETEAAQTKPAVETRAVAGRSAKGVKGTRSAGRRGKKLHS